MERRAVEFHDSRVRVIRWSGADAILEVSVYVHSSEGRPGCDDGRGWYHDAEMVVAGAEIRQRPASGGLNIIDGTVRVDDQVFDNLMPLPCDMTGKVEIAFSGHEGTFAATGRGIRILLKGGPGPVQEF
jgi:hypothetical protein